MQNFAMHERAIRSFAKQHGDPVMLAESFLRDHIVIGVRESRPDKTLALEYGSRVEGDQFGGMRYGLLKAGDGRQIALEQLDMTGIEFRDYIHCTNVSKRIGAYNARPVAMSAINRMQAKILRVMRMSALSWSEATVAIDAARSAARVLFESDALAHCKFAIDSGDVVEFHGRRFIYRLDMSNAMRVRFFKDEK